MWYYIPYRMDNYLPFDVTTISFLPRLFSLLKVAMAPPMILCPYDSSISMNWISYTNRGYEITLVFKAHYQFIYQNQF